MPEQTATVSLASPDATCALARALAPRLSVGDVLLISGPVGAGKTHFARCLITSLLPCPEDVPSPTYTLVQTYAGRKAEIWHADLYRLNDPGELLELGLGDAFTQAICLVEWPEALGDLAPRNALSLSLSPGATEQERALRLSWTDAAWTTRLRGIADV